MREPGLEEAIRAAGGVGQLARQIGISQPSVSNWFRVPAERVISVEATTGVDRAVLRPDLYGGEEGSEESDEVGNPPAQGKALLPPLFVRGPCAALLSKSFQLRRPAPAL